jgi:Trk K+ transport system NAD-binding subunit
MDLLRAYNDRLEAGMRDASRRDLDDTQLRGYRVVELELGASAAPVGARLGELPLPPGSTVLGLRRDGEALTPDDDTQLAAGDRLTLLVPVAAADEVAEEMSEHTPA